jgi:N-acetyl sugar amidotransferase
MDEPVKMKKADGYQMCVKTIMDTTDEDIMFDDNGICNHYYKYKRLEPYYTYKGKETDLELEKIVEQIKKSGKGKDYDCLIGLSGGVDSSYVAYNAKKLGLRALTVHFDNGWNSELAVKNIENIVKKLNFDYQTWVVNWEEFKDLQLAFIKASVANIETPTDHAFLAALYRIADKYHIKYILSGSNFVTEGILPTSWGYNAKDLTHLRAIHKRFGKIPLKTYPTLGLYKELYYTYFKKIKMIRLLNYLPYVKSEAMKTIQTELDWKYYGGKHYESVFTRFFQGYILPVKFNIDKRKAHLSTLIMSGQITREQALQEIQKPPLTKEQINEDKIYVTKKLDLTLEEFDQIMQQKPKKYNQYPNNEKIRNWVYKIYNKIKYKQ